MSAISEAQSLVFQSTLRRTERHCSVRCFHINVNFNPRSGERSDIVIQLLPFIYLDFNPRSGERSDEILFCKFRSLAISIHAPANGATVHIAFICRLAAISIHAPANGATYHLPFLFTFDRFQSTLRRTERRYFTEIFSHTPYFNPRSGERSDGKSDDYCSKQQNFNPRSGERSDIADVS